MARLGVFGRGARLGDSGPPVPGSGRRRAGRRVAPPLFDSIELLGRDKTLDRLARAVKLAEGAA